MTNELTTVNNGSMTTFPEEKIDLIKRTVAKNTTNEQLALFLHQARRTGLDPLSRQIHCVLRWNNRTQQRDMSIQVAIDGYRLIADRTGKYAGSDDYQFNNGMTQYQHLTSGERFPQTATVTVYKIVASHRVPFTATAQWDAYYPGDKQGFMWKKMPYLMLGKCAEALALRKAFPAELSGVYVREEMEQAGFTEVEPPTVEGEIVKDEQPEQEEKKTEVADDKKTYWQALTDTEKKIYKHPADFVKLTEGDIERYHDNPFGVTGAAQKFVKDIPTKKTTGDGKARVTLYRRIKTYAELRDAGMDSEKAASDALSQVK